MQLRLLSNENIRAVQSNILQLLSTQKVFSEKRITNSPRAVGDIVQTVIEESFEECVPSGVLKDYKKDFARRAMADFAFYDFNDNYYVVDCKTHNKNTKFNMPNLTSVERLSRFYEDDSNAFMILMISYEIDETEIKFNDCVFHPIEHFAWDCLTIGALGWGQIQIANANKINIIADKTRKEWMLELCDALDLFYPREIEKILDRQSHFHKIREFWTSK
ncbi:MAG: hypothetical protein FWB93_00280 [Oscillospiraceae bacterium]|nr:hypothetical protein [Oscillospiraceae bacterium]